MYLIAAREFYQVPLFDRIADIKSFKGLAKLIKIWYNIQRLRHMKGLLKMAERNTEKNIRLRNVIIIYIILVAVNFLFVNYIKMLTTYNDEYYYVNVARNIFRGEGPIVDGLEMTFDKVLYSFFIAPAYIIKNAVLRVKIISLINCMLMSSSLFPIWLISRDINLSRGNTFWALIITGVFPELSMSMSFMSENLFFPLVLFFIRFWLVNSQKPAKKNAVILGILGFLCYFCKASFLAIFISCAAFEIVFPAVSYLVCGREKSEKLRSFYSKERFINLAVFAAVFAVLNIILKLTVFYSEKSSYQLRSISEFFEAYRLGYAVYAAFYIISGIMISALILPFVYPVLQYTKLNEPSKKLFCFNVISILMTIAVVVYTITAYEDYGTAQPEVHMRYFSHFVLIAFLLFLKSIEKSYNEENNKRPGYWAAIIMTAVMPCMIYRGMQADSPAVHSLLKFHEDYRDNIGSLSIDPQEWFQAIKDQNRIWILDSRFPIEIHLYAILFGAVMFLLVFMFHWLFTHRREKPAIKLGILFIIAIMTVNSLDSRNQWRSRNSDENDYVSEILAANDYFSGNHERFNMIYITGSKFSKCRSTVDTYLNLENRQHIFTVESDWLDIDDLAQNDFIVEKTIFKNTCGYVGSNMNLDYDTIESFDYVLIDKTADLMNYQLSGVTTELETDNFILYRNDDPKTLLFEQNDILTYKDGILDILSKEYISADYIVTENGGADIEDVIIEVNVPVDKAFKSFDVHVELENKLDGYQLFIAQQDGENICIDAVNGEGEVNFTAEADNGLLSFDILLPNVKLEYLEAKGIRLINSISCPIKNIEICEASYEEDVK